MPIYDYQCSDCHHRFEARQGFDAEPVQQCPRCRGAARRRFHPVGVIYKGTGFYTTDYKRTSASFPSSDGDGEKKAEPSGAREGEKAKTPTASKE